MSSYRKNEQFKGQVKNAFIRPGEEKTEKKEAENIRDSKGLDHVLNDRTSDERMNKADLPDSSSTLRSEKVQAARKKKQNGDYDNQEVYQRIAERLMDLFGI